MSRRSPTRSTSIASVDRARLRAIAIAPLQLHPDYRAALLALDASGARPVNALDPMLHPVVARTDADGRLVECDPRLLDVVASAGGGMGERDRRSRRSPRWRDWRGGWASRSRAAWSSPTATTTSNCACAPSPMPMA